MTTLIVGSLACGAPRVLLADVFLIVSFVVDRMIKICDPEFLPTCPHEPDPLATGSPTLSAPAASKTSLFRLMTGRSFCWC